MVRSVADRTFQPWSVEELCTAISVRAFEVREEAAASAPTSGADGLRLALAEVATLSVIIGN